MQPVPGTPFAFAKEGAGRSKVPYLALHRTGFSVPPRLRSERWALTPPFHPYRASRSQIWNSNLKFKDSGGLIFCGTIRWDASRHRHPRVSPSGRLAPTGPKLRGIPPYGVRTFLPALSRTASGQLL